MTAREITYVGNRALNLWGYTFVPDDYEPGRVRRLNIGFPCDKCGMDESRYRKDETLFCASCWVKSVTAAQTR